MPTPKPDNHGARSALYWTLYLATFDVLFMDTKDLPQA